MRRLKHCKFEIFFFFYPSLHTSHDSSYNYELLLKLTSFEHSTDYRPNQFLDAFRFHAIPLIFEVQPRNQGIMFKNYNFHPWSFQLSPNPTRNPRENNFSSTWNMHRPRSTPPKTTNDKQRMTGRQKWKKASWHVTVSFFTVVRRMSSPVCTRMRGDIARRGSEYKGIAAEVGEGDDGRRPTGTYDPVGKDQWPYGCPWKEPIVPQERVVSRTLGKKHQTKPPAFTESTDPAPSLDRVHLASFLPHRPHFFRFPSIVVPVQRSREKGIVERKAIHGVKTVFSPIPRVGILWSPLSWHNRFPLNPSMSTRDVNKFARNWWVSFSHRLWRRNFATCGV